MLQSTCHYLISKVPLRLFASVEDTTSVRHKQQIFFPLLIASLFPISCAQPKSAPIAELKPIPAVESRRLSATEEFHLRGECANLAAKLEDQEHSSDLLSISETWSSNYKADDNRCYVEQSSYDKSTHHSAITLFDGQTREVLAFVKDDQNGTKGQVGDRFDIAFTLDCVSPGSDCGYAVILAYIEKCMQRDPQ
jgi:hypothetical protein